MATGGIFATIVASALSAQSAQSARTQVKQAQARQEERNKARRDAEAKERTQASFRLLGRRKRRATTGTRRTTILTGSQLGGASGDGKELIGE